MSQATTTKWDAAGFDGFVAGRGEPEWLTTLRREAWQHADAMGWPERRHEEWMRTDIRMFRLDRYGMPTSDPPKLESNAQLREGVELAGQMRTVDSAVVSESLDESVAEQGVVFGSLERLCGTHPELIRPELFTVFDPDYDKFAAMHAAFWSGGQFLYVPRGVTVDRPLHIGSMMSDGGIDTTHTLVVLEEGAEATLLHESNSPSPNAGGLHMGAVELIVKPGAKLRYV